MSGVEIIPSINVPTFKEVGERIAKIESYVSWCHIDVTDGIFSRHATWHSPEDFSKLNTKLNIEVHLMVEDPDRRIDDWLIPPVRRVIMHAEAVKDFAMMVGKCRDREVMLGIAIKPETSWEILRPYFGRADMVQLLAVHPGPSSQPMAENTFDKIEHIRNACAECIIEVDGGINPDNMKKSALLGAKIFVVGNYIFSNPEPRVAIETLRRAISL